MSKGKSECFSGNWTSVFWLIDDYPVPSGVHIDSIHENMEAALLQMGFDKVQPIKEYCDNKENDAPAPLKMVWQILLRAAAMGGESVNIIVIAKLSTHPELHRVLQCLESRNFPVLVVEPKDSSVHSLVASTRDLRGGKPPRPEAYTFPIDFGVGSGSGSNSDFDSEDIALRESPYRWRRRYMFS